MGVEMGKGSGSSFVDGFKLREAERSLGEVEAKGWVSQWGRVRRASRELGLEGGGRCMAMVGLSVERGLKEKIASFSIRIISGQVFSVPKAVRIIIAMQ